MIQITIYFWRKNYGKLIVPIIILKKFMKLNVNTNKMIKNVKNEKLDTNIAIVFLKTQNLKMI